MRAHTIHSQPHQEMKIIVFVPSTEKKMTKTKESRKEGLVAFAQKKAAVKSYHSSSSSVGECFHCAYARILYLVFAHLLFQFVAYTINVYMCTCNREKHHVFPSSSLFYLPLYRTKTSFCLERFLSSLNLFGLRIIVTHPAALHTRILCTHFQRCKD